MRGCFPCGLIVRALLASGALVAGGAGRAAAQPTETFSWSYATPESQGVDAAPLARMFAQIQRDAVPIHSFVLVRHDRVVSEAYVYPYNAMTRHPMYSVSKSFTSALIGIAIEQGLFTGVEERVVDIFNGVTTHPASANLAAMQLRHLLTMATGHASDTTYRIIYTSDWEKAFLELPVEEAPGTRFVYNSGGSFMLAAAVQRRSGMTALAFADRHLFGPLGITNYTWDQAPHAIITGGWGLSLRPLDMARFGRLYLHQGEWEGRQIVPAAWVAESSRAQMANGTEGFWGSGYGYQFWLNDFGGYRADGARAQYIFILPDHDTVAVFTCDLVDSELPARLMRTFVLPALARDEPLPANPRGSALLAAYAQQMGAAPVSRKAPVFTRLPEGRTANAGETVTLSVAGTGSPAPGCQWYRNERALGGATSLALTLPDVTAADAGDYVAVLSNEAGALASVPARLVVLSAPVVVRDPVSVEGAEGEDVFLEVEAGGGELAYAWTRDGVAVAGANERGLTLRGITMADAGDYRVVVTNPRGTLTSAAAKVSVAAADERARLVNLSARSPAGDGERTLIVGLVVDGRDRSCGLPVLLRGAGPALADAGLGEVLADPAIVLHRGGTAVDSNGDWGGDARIAATGARVGAGPLPVLGCDAALQTVLKPDVYSLHVVSGLPGQSGVALAECYEAAGKVTAGSPRLVNLSARTAVGAGERTLIGGFVIAGQGTLRVLLRGVGPGMKHAVPGALDDPELRLFSGGELVAQNDDWGGGADLLEVFAKTGAGQLETGSRDAALVVTLPAGVYTAHLNGKGGASGIGLVEIYAVPQ